MLCNLKLYQTFFKTISKIQEFLIHMLRITIIIVIKLEVSRIFNIGISWDRKKNRIETEYFQAYSENNCQKKNKKKLRFHSLFNESRKEKKKIEMLNNWSNNCSKSNWVKQKYEFFFLGKKKWNKKSISN